MKNLSAEGPRRSVFLAKLFSVNFFISFEIFSFRLSHSDLIQIFSFCRADLSRLSDRANIFASLSKWFFAAVVNGAIPIALQFFSLKRVERKFLPFRESLAASVEISADVLGTKTSHGLFCERGEFCE